MANENNKIGLIPATLMVAGNMMGSGVFMLPANLAAIGSIAIFGWLITIVGAVALGLVFSKLTQIYTAAGGPYAYSRKAFGDYMGYQTNLVYWLANVVGNVGLAVAGLGYLTTFFPSLKDPLIMALAQIGVIWFFTYANILGPNIVGRIQGMTTTVALLPIVGMAVFGWFWFSRDTYMAGWNVTGESNLTALGMTLNFTLWAFIGVESASVSTAVVKDPARNVPIATVVGVLLAAVCYILSSSAIMGIIPNKELIASSAPFSDAVSMALGPVAGNIVALCAAVGCLGSLGGWTLLVGQTAKAAADEAFEAKWDRIMAIRDDVKKVLEQARADKVIGSALEAGLTLYCSKEVYDFLNAIPMDELADLFIVSHVDLVEGEGGVKGLVEGLGVSAAHAAGNKCLRCWKYETTVGEDGLCPRCAKVLKQ